VSIESIHRGLVRPEDKRKAEAAKSGGNGENETGGDEGEESDEVKLSAALVEDLTAHRTASLRAGASNSPGCGAGRCGAQPRSASVL
jgi:ParB family transcriptional regulator, chromosome partitioning protein